MNKRSKIITWVVVALLAVAVFAVIFTNLLNGGASEISYDKFAQYVENLQYKIAVRETESNPDSNSSSGGGNAVLTEVVIDSITERATNAVEKATIEAVAKSPEYYVIDASGKDMTDLGYTVKDGTIYLGEEKLIVIKKISIVGYNLAGFVQSTRNPEELTRAYVTVGPSFFSSPANNSVIESWRELGLEITFEDPNSGNYWSSILSIGSMVLLVVVVVIMFRSATGGGRGAMSFAKTKARVSTNIKVRFSDVAGAEEEKVELAEIVEFLKHPQKFTDVGARIPKGVLLVGPPGTGKTLFAKAVAGEAGVPFFSVSGSDFVEMYVGVGASRVRDLFEMAKKNSPCIIFIDEIDAVGRHRGAGLGGGNDEREQTLNQILVQMDGFENSEGVIVMAATNRSDILDPALTRPGRFDRQVFVNLPDVKGREQILKVHARNKPLATDVNFKTIAKLTSGFSGADLANLLNEAAILAARENKRFIDNTDLYEAFTKVAMGPKKKSKVVTESEKRITAYHESGHAILARLCPKCHPVQEVTIIPRGRAGGYTLMIPEKDDSYLSKNFLLDEICMSLGGRAAEEIVIHDITTGASADINGATDTARRMVTEWGMSEKLGALCYGSSSQTVFLGKDMETHNKYSEETAKVIDEEMRSIVDGAYKRAIDLLTEHRSVLDNMARVLVERETIYNDEVEMLMEGKTYSEVIAYMDRKEEKSNTFKRFN